MRCLTLFKGYCPLNLSGGQANWMTKWPCKAPQSQMAMQVWKGATILELALLASGNAQQADLEHKPPTQTHLGHGIQSRATSSCSPCNTIRVMSRSTIAWQASQVAWHKCSGGLACEPLASTSEHPAHWAEHRRLAPSVLQCMATVHIGEATVAWRSWGLEQPYMGAAAPKAVHVHISVRGTEHSFCTQRWQQLETSQAFHAATYLPDAGLL